MANPNFLTANTSGIELMPGVNDQAQGYDVNRIIQALNGTNILPITVGSLTVSGTLTLTGGSTPATPTGLTATPYRQGVFLTWNEITPGTVSPKQYEIAVSTDNFSSILSQQLSDVIVITGPSSTPNPYVVTVGPGNSFYYPYPVAGATLYFKIRARDWAGNVSAYSSVVNTTTTNLSSSDIPNPLTGPFTINNALTVNGGLTVDSVTINSSVVAPDSSFTLQKLLTQNGITRASLNQVPANFGSGASFTTVSGPSLQITPAITSQLIVFWQVSSHTGGAAGAGLNYQLILDGTTTGFTANGSNIGGGSSTTITVIDLFPSVSAGLHTLQLQVQTPAGASTVIFDGSGVQIFALAIP